MIEPLIIYRNERGITIHSNIGWSIEERENGYHVYINDSLLCNCGDIDRAYYKLEEYFNNGGSKWSFKSTPNTIIDIEVKEL